MLRVTRKNGSMRSSSENSKPEKAAGNRLFPIFLKMEGMKVLIVGGGTVATEKLNTILANAPAAVIRVISKTFSAPLRKLSRQGNVELLAKVFDPADLDWADIVFSAVNDLKT